MAIVGVLGLLISLINLLLKVNRNHKLLMDSKVNITEFKEHCAKNDMSFKEINEKQITVQLETNKILATMSTNIGVLKNDIAWMKNKQIQSNDTD
jgi:hypothetical protein